MDSKDILRRVGETLNRKNEDSKRDKEQTEKERRELVTSIGKDISEALLPYMQSMAEKSQITKEDIKAALSEVQINIPESNVHIPEFKIPTPQVTVNVPEAKLPQINIPETKFPDRMSVGLENYSNKTPMPVMLMDTQGKPFTFSFPTSTGGKNDFFTVKGITNTVGMVAINPDGSPAGAGSVASSVSVSDIFSTVGSNVVNADGRVRVSVETGGSGITDSEIRATALPVSQLSGASWSTSVVDIFGSVASNVVNPDGRIKVELPTGSSGLTDTELRASHLDVQQVSGAIDSVNVLTMPSVTVTSITNSTSVTVLNGEGVARDTWGASQVGTWTVTGITNTIATANIDSSGVQYSGSNPMPVSVTGITGTTSSGYTRQANPTAIASDFVPLALDDLGRQLTRPIQVRDLIRTAYVSVANGTETTLLAATAGTYIDLIMIVGSNNSDAAVSVDIRSGTAGNIINTLRIPANGTAGFTPAVPWPQDATGNTWTVDGPDETGRTLTFSALFSQEV